MAVYAATPRPAQIPPSCAAPPTVTEPPAGGGREPSPCGMCTYSVAFAPDGATLASGSMDKTIKLWSVASRAVQATLTAHTNGVWSVAFAPDGATLASGSADRTIKLWTGAREVGTLLRLL